MFDVSYWDVKQIYFLFPITLTQTLTLSRGRVWVQVG